MIRTNDAESYRMYCAQLYRQNDGLMPDERDIALYCEAHGAEITALVPEGYEVIFLPGRGFYD